MRDCHDLVRAAVSNLTALLTNQDLVVATPLNIAEETSSSATSAARISHDVGAMKHLLYGIPEAPPDRVKAAELATEILRSELLEVLIVQLASLPFECRKDAAQVFSNLLRKHSSDEPSAVTAGCSRFSASCVWVSCKGGWCGRSNDCSVGFLMRSCSRYRLLGRI